MIPKEFLLFAKGTFQAQHLGDDVAEFIVDDYSIESILNAQRKRAIKLSFDYEHQSVYGDGDSPAAGWFDLEVRPDGLWAVNIRWTENAAKRLESKEYAYYSPTFIADKKGRVIELHSVALTNHPATIGQKPLIPLKQTEYISLTLGLCKEEREPSMDKELVELLAACGASSIQALKGNIEGLKAFQKENETLKGELVSLKGLIDLREKEAIVAKNPTKISPAMEKWALAQTIESLNAYLAIAPDIIPTEKASQPSTPMAGIDKAEKIKLECKGKSWNELTSMQKHNLFYADKAAFDALYAGKEGE